MSVEGRMNVGQGQDLGEHGVRNRRVPRAKDDGPRMPRGAADPPARIIETAAAISAHTRHVVDLYLRAYQVGYDLAGHGLGGGASSSGGSMVENAVTESVARARAQDAAVKASKDVREAEKRLGAALSALERAGVQVAAARTGREARAAAQRGGQ